MGGTGLIIRCCMNRVLVAGIIPDGPAHKSKRISLNDDLVAIESRPVNGLSHIQIASMLAGDVGSQVLLTLSPPNEGGNHPSRAYNVYLCREYLHTHTEDVSERKINHIDTPDRVARYNSQPISKSTWAEAEASELETQQPSIRHFAGELITVWRRIATMRARYRRLRSALHDRLLLLGWSAFSDPKPMCIPGQAPSSTEDGLCNVLVERLPYLIEDKKQKLEGAVRHTRTCNPHLSVAQDCSITADFVLYSPACKSQEPVETFDRANGTLTPSLPCIGHVGFSLSSPPLPLNASRSAGQSGLSVHGFLRRVMSLWIAVVWAKQGLQRDIRRNANRSRSRLLTCFWKHWQKNCSRHYWNILNVCDDERTRNRIKSRVWSAFVRLKEGEFKHHRI